MIINPEYEKLFIKRMNDLHEYLIRGIMLRHELWNSWCPAEGRVCLELSQSRYMAISEAASYINYNTGEFRPGEYISVCPDNAELAFKKLKQIVRLQKDLLSIPASRILGEINARLNAIKEMLQKMRSTVGETRANERLKQLLDAYPHLKNTFPIKGVNEMNFDMKICYLDAVTSWHSLDAYTVGRQKRLCSMHDDIVRSYAEQRLDKEGAKDRYYHVSMKPKYTYNVEKNGKLIQGWGEQKITDNSYYRGQYLNGMKNGYGEYKSENNYWYRGSIVNEIMEGYGVCFYENGDCYEGWWKANDWHGKGTLYKADGKVYSGYFNLSQFISEYVPEEPLKVPPMVEKSAYSTPTQPQKPTYSAVNSTLSSNTATQKSYTATSAKPTTTTTSSYSSTKTATNTATSAKPTTTTTNSYSSTKTTTNTTPSTTQKATATVATASNSTTTNSTIKKQVLDGPGLILKEEVDGKTNGFKFTKFSSVEGGYFSEAVRFHRHGLGCTYLKNNGSRLFIGIYVENKRNGVGLKIDDGKAIFGIWKDDDLVKELVKYDSLKGFETNGISSALLYKDAKIFDYNDRHEVTTVNAKGEKIGCGLCTWKDGKKCLSTIVPGESTGIPLMAGLGIIYYPDGSYYLGSIYNSKAYGIGMQYKKDGTYLCGKWLFDSFKG